MSRAPADRPAGHLCLIDENCSEAITEFSTEQILMHLGFAALGDAQQSPSMVLVLLP